MKSVMFKSDTTAPVCPEIMKMLNEINKDCELGYGRDKYTKKVEEIMQSYFTKPVGIHMCTSGSASNVLAIKAMKHNYSSIICCEEAHMNKYEVGGTEYNTGCKFVTCDSKDAKLTVDMIKSKLWTKDSHHWAYPEIVSLTQVTEFGTCYTCKELKEICDFCHENGLYVYIDGARLANAMANQNCGFKEMLEDTGVDIASFGANKNGAMFGEMIIVLNPEFEKHFHLNQRQSMQVFSKSRFLGGQFLAYLEQNVWLKNARHANEMSEYLAKKMSDIGYNAVFPVQSNTVIIEFEKDVQDHIKAEYGLGTYEDRTFTRIMTCWCTTKEEIDEFINYIKDYKDKK